MIEEVGTLVSLDGSYAEVRAERRGGCGACAADGACGTSVFDRVLGRRPVLLRVHNRIGAQVGERVIVGVSEQGLLGAALAAYLVPLLALMGGAILGDWLTASPITDGAEQGSGDPGAVAGAVLAFLIALAWLRLHTTRRALDPRYLPIILRREADTQSQPVSLPVPRPRPIPRAFGGD